MSPTPLFVDLPVCLLLQNWSNACGMACHRCGKLSDCFCGQADLEKHEVEVAILRWQKGSVTEGVTPATGTVPASNWPILLDAVFQQLSEPKVIVLLLPPCT